MNTRNQPEPQREQEVDLSNYVAKQEYDNLQASYNQLQGQISDLKGKMKSVEGLENLGQDELMYLKKIKHDYETTPLGVIVSDYYDNKFDPNKFVMSKQSPQEYMEGEVLFDVNESYQVGTDSFKAREKFDNDKLNVTQTYGQIAQYLKEEHSKVTKTPEEAQKEWNDQQEGLLNQVTDKFPNASKNMPTFQAWLNKQPNVYMLLYAQFSQAVKAAMTKNRGNINTPNPSIPAGGSETVYNEPNTNQELIDVFGD